MRTRKALSGILLMLVMAVLIIMTLPASEADAATSASDFVIEGGKLVKYQGTDKNVSIPGTVEIIGESAFEENSDVELVVIPNTVKRIDAYAFWGCNNLSTVMLGRGLTEVGDYAFAGCKGLKQMSIPVNITSIGIQAFGDCINMTDISIPAETIRIHETAFDGCIKLTIHCDEGTVADTFAKDFYERQKQMAEYEESEVQRPDEAPVPTSAPEIMDEKGYSTIVGNSAMVFLDTSGLTVIEPTPPPVLEELVVEALTEFAVTVGNVISIGGAVPIPKYTVIDEVLVADEAFYGNTALDEVNLRKGIREIGEFSFARSSARRAVLPEGVAEIGYGAFYYCKNLATVELPETVMNVGPRAFADTLLMKTFLSSGEDFLINGGVLLAYNGDDSFVSVPGGVRVIAAEAFAGHEEMQSIRLPDSVLVIGEAAFEGCTGLKRVNLGDGVEQIKDRAFAGCTALDMLKLPKSVEEAGLQAFGRADVIYGGELPKSTYEVSATRLSNESFRNPGRETLPPGVIVVGENPAAARLEGAARNYILRVERQADSKGMEKAWNRVMEAAMPENMTVYDLQLTDNSGIPIQDLGYKGLVVTLPLPEELAGQELHMVTMDRNGQLETLGVECITHEGGMALRFRTIHLSLFGVYGTNE